MLLFISIIVLLFMLFTQWRKKNFMSPLFIFSAIWILIIGLYSLRLFQINDVSFNTVLVLFLGTISYGVGYLLCEKIHIKRSSEKIHYINLNNLKVVFGLIIISSLPFYLPRIYAVIQGGSAALNKILLTTGEIDHGGVGMQYIVRPFEFLIVAVSAYFIFNKKNEIFLIILGGVVTVVKFLATGSKASIIYYLLCVVIMFVFSKNGVEKQQKKQIKNSRKIVLAIVIIIIVYLLNYMNVLTTGFKNLYFYICGCVPMLDAVLNEDFYFNQGYTYGFLSFNSIARLIIKAFSLLGINMDTHYFDIANSYIDRFEYTKQIAPDVNYNAFVTIFGNFYADFGYFGVIFLSVVFGVFSCYVYRQLLKNKSLQNHVIYCILIYYIIFSMVRFQMSNTVLGLTLFYSCTIMGLIVRLKFKVK